MILEIQSSMISVNDSNLHVVPQHSGHQTCFSSKCRMLVDIKRNKNIWICKRQSLSFVRSSMPFSNFASHLRHLPQANPVACSLQNPDLSSPSKLQVFVFGTETPPLTGQPWTTMLPSASQTYSFEQKGIENHRRHSVASAATNERCSSDHVFRCFDKHHTISVYNLTNPKDATRSKGHRY